MRTWKNGILLPFLLVLLWYIISKLQIFSSYLLPSPAATAITAGELIRSGMLWQHLLISLQRVAGGFLCSVVVALPLGILCGRSNSFQSYCWPILEFLRHVPPLAAIPLIILWFGIDEGSKLVIIFLASFFPLFLNTYSGIKGCDRKLLEVGRSLHFTAWQQARLIQLPASASRYCRRFAAFAGLQLAGSYRRRVNSCFVRDRLYDFRR